MSSDDPSGPRPATPIVLRIKLRYDDIDVMVQRFATNVGKSGLFLPTKSIQPIGAEVKFELRLADDTPALVGLGRVKLAKAPDPDDPKAAFGMAIELMRVTPQSRALILRMLDQRRVLGLPDLGLPTPDDIDAARRAEVAEAAPAMPAPPPPAIDPHPGEALLTAPRRTTGPLAIAKVLAVAPLAPEPPRRKRPAVSELIESASGPVAGVAAATPGLDDDVDLAAAIVRARSLAGGALDAELDALCEVAAAPLEISIEAASAELAKQLGGSAVRRDRSARWAPPPATATPAPAEPPSAEPPSAEPGSPPEATLEATPEPIAEADRAPAPPARTSAEHEVAPEQIADEIHQLHDLDLEDVEHTEMGGAPSPEASFDQHGFTQPSVADQLVLAARLEAQLADAEAEAEADDLGLARALGAADPDLAAGYADRAELREDGAADSPLDVSLEEIDDFEILAEADADDEDLLAAHGEQDSRDSITLPPAGTRPSSEIDFAARLDLGEDSDIYYSVPPDEFSAHHVLDGVPGELPDDPETDGVNEFDDEPRVTEAHFHSARNALAAFDNDDSDPGAAHGGGVQPIFEPDPSSSFTLAGAPSESFDLEIPVLRPEPIVPTPLPKVQPAAARREPAILRTSPPFPSLLESPVEDHELEHALEALDVDLDDLAIPHAATELQRDLDPRSRPSAKIRPANVSRAPQPQGRAVVPMPAQSQAPAARQPAARSTPAPVSAPRMTTDDGVVIDFEDDD